MRRLSTSLAVALSVAVLGTVLAAAVIGLADDGHIRYALLGWSILAFVLALILTEPARLTAPVVGVGAALLYTAGVILQLRLDKVALPDGLDGRTLVFPAAALFVAPFFVRQLLKEIEAADRKMREQEHVIDELTVRDTQTGAFKPKYIESILGEEIDRARRYQRSLTLAIIAADDWNAVVEEMGEGAARGVAQQIIEQIAKNTRTVDKIVQLGDGSFALILPETPLEGAEVLAARLQTAASRAAGFVVRIGLADFPRDAVTAEALLQEAREALTFARTADLLVVDRTLLGHPV